MLDLIIISHKLTINFSVAYQEYIQYLVDYTYNIRPLSHQSWIMFLRCVSENKL